MSDAYLSLWHGRIAAPRRREFLPGILKEVAFRHDLDVRDITGPSRRRAIVRARQEAMWEARQRTPLSLPEIGRRLGGRDHSTVLHGVRKHAERMGAYGASVTHSGN